MSSYCGICFDSLDGVQRIVATSCGHVYHSICLQKWLEESETCPECKKKTSKGKVIGLYFNFKSSDSINNLSLGNEMESLNTLLEERRKEARELLAKNTELRKIVAEHENNISDLHQVNMKLEHDLRESLNQVTRLRLNVDNTNKTNVEYTDELQRLKDIQEMVVGSQKDADEYLKQVTKGLSSETDLSVSQTLVHCCSFIKRDLLQAISHKEGYLKQLVEFKKNLGLTSSKLRILQSTIKSLEERIKELEGTKSRPTFENNSSSEVPISQKSKIYQKKLLEMPERKKQKIGGLKRFEGVTAVRESTSPILFPSSSKHIGETDSDSRFTYIDLTEFTKNKTIETRVRNSFLGKEQLCARLKKSKVLKRHPMAL